MVDWDQSTNKQTNKLLGTRCPTKNSKHLPENKQTNKKPEEDEKRRRRRRIRVLSFVAVDHPPPPLSLRGFIDFYPIHNFGVTSKTNRLRPCRRVTKGKHTPYQHHAPHPSPHRRHCGIMSVTFSRWRRGVRWGKRERDV